MQLELALDQEFKWNVQFEKNPRTGKSEVKPNWESKSELRLTTFYDRALHDNTCNASKESPAWDCSWEAMVIATKVEAWAKAPNAKALGAIAADARADKVNADNVRDRALG